MSFLNEVTIMGNLGKKPELNFFPDGTPVLRLSIATTEKYHNKKGELEESVTWHPVQMTGRLAEVIAQYVDKGDKLLIKGKIKKNNYTNAQGVVHSGYIIHTDKAIMINTKNQSGIAANPLEAEVTL